MSRSRTTSTECVAVWATSLQPLPLLAYDSCRATVLCAPQHVEMGKTLRSVCVALLGGKQATSIFAMLLHRWLFIREKGDQPPEMLTTKHVYILLSGAQFELWRFTIHCPLSIASSPEVGRQPRVDRL